MALYPIARSLTTEATARRIECAQRLFDFGSVPGRISGRGRGIDVADIGVQSIFDAFDDSAQRHPRLKRNQQISGFGARACAVDIEPIRKASFKRAF